MNNTQLVRPFVSGHSRARALIVLLVIGILLSIIAILSTYSQIQLISRIMSGLPVTEAEARASDDRQQTIGGLQLLTYIATGILFLMWIHRAHSNLSALGVRNPRFSPRWAVGYWFIPIVNLFRPYQVVQEIWKASDPNADVWESASVSPIVDGWWTSWVVLELVTLITRASRASTPAELLNASWLIIIVNILSIVSAVFAILVVQGIDKRQKAKSTHVAMPKTLERSSGSV